MTDHNDLPAWRKKFLATRMAFESILFEREVGTLKKEKSGKGLLVLGGIWLFFSLLLAQWALRRGYFFGGADAASFRGVLRYADYLSAHGPLALFKPEFSGLSLNPPLYYLAYLPVLKYITSDLNLALIIVNSAFMLVLALSIFLAVRMSRPNQAGWFGAAIALSMPFVLETARRPSPEMALIAMVAAVYACYIRSDEFSHPKWTFSFAVCLGLGFFSHRFFWIYALPLLPFLTTGISNPYTRDELLKGFLPGVLINLPWYAFIVSAAAAGLVPLQGAYPGFWAYLKLGVSSAGLPLFALGSAALAWLCFSVFMSYKDKKLVGAWFWVPYLALTFLVRGGRPELFYPALIPFAVALPVMTPHRARKYLMAFVLVLGTVNQSGLVAPLRLGGYSMLGLPLPLSRVYRSPELVGLLRANMPAGGGLAGIYGGDSSLNADSLRFAVLKDGSNIKFEDEPACPACPSALIARGPRFGETPSKSMADFAELKKTSWFTALFEKRGELEARDTSKIEVFAKVRPATKYFNEGTVQIRGLVLGQLKIDEASLTLKKYNEASGVYEEAELFAPYASVLGGDVYGLKLDIRDLAAAGPGTDPFVPAGVGSVNVRSAKISSYAVERYITDRYPFISGLRINIDDTLEMSGKARGRDFSAVFALALAKDGVLEARPLAFTFASISLPDYFLELFSFRLTFADNPYGVRISGLRMKGQMLELY